MTIAQAVAHNKNSDLRPLWKDPIPKESTLRWYNLDGMYAYLKTCNIDQVLMGIPLELNKSYVRLTCKTITHEEFRALPKV